MIARMPNVEAVLRLRWLLWGIGAILPCLAWLGRRRLARLRLPWPFAPALVSLLGTFALAAVAAKLTQRRALALNAQDFWLFVDMLRQMAAGAPFLTRFAPQATGWVQHGAVHPFFSLYALLPVAWLGSAESAMLLLNPLALTAAAGVLALWVRELPGNPARADLRACLAAAAFLLCSPVGRALMYEAHPETLYPLGIFLWLWTGGVGTGRVRWVPFALSALFAALIKEDAFLVLLPIAVGQARRAPRAAAIGAGVVLAAAAFQFLAVARWGAGAWGPALWQGLPVHLPSGPAAFQGHRWDSPASAGAILATYFDRLGGARGAVAALLRFLTSRPWLGLLALAPWVIPTARFWVWSLPLAAAHALLGGIPATLSLYYGAPFIALLFAAAWLAIGERPRGWKLVWLLSATCLFGSGGLEWFRPSRLAREIREQARAFAPCLPAQGRGLVSPALLGEVPEETVYTDRIPMQPTEWESLRFVLFTPDLPRFELGAQQNQEIRQHLATEPGWVRLGDGCRRQKSDAQAANTPVQLWIRTVLVRESP
jgi:hypothetical protein